MEYRNRSKAVKTILERDPDFYKKNGQKGGKAKVPKGFAIMKEKNPERLKEISQKGAKESNDKQGKGNEQV